MNNNKSFTRKDFWIRAIASYAIAMFVGFLISIVAGNRVSMYIYVPMVIYWIIIEVKRFHDANKTGWLALINLIPGLGTFAALIVAGLMESNYDNNKWYTGV